MKVLSVCSGIDAAHLAWKDMFDWVGISEIDAFPAAVCAHHNPEIPNLGDMTSHGGWNIERPDILVGGTPCQSFSVAGLRKGLDDPRGNLALVYLAIADQFRPDWLVWENVPGVLSSNGGRDFGSFLGAMGQLGYGWAYRVCDAQHFGVPQRRRRVFVVGHSGGWQRAAAVLFERESLRRNPPPGRQAGQGVAPPIAGCSNGGGANGPGRTADDAEALIPETAKSVRTMSGGIDREDMHKLIPAHIPDVANPLTARMQKGVNTTLDEGVTPIAFSMEQISSPENRSNPQPGDPCITLGARAHQISMVHWQQGGGDVEDQLSGALRADAEHNWQFLRKDLVVRRLTPVECERLQGFPDNYTRIPWRGKPAEKCPDGPRYKALGNSMAVPVMRWIGQRIREVSEISEADPSECPAQRRTG